MAYPGVPKSPKIYLTSERLLEQSPRFLIIRRLLSLSGSTGVTTNRSPQFNEPEHLGLPIAEGVRGGERRTAINHKKIPSHSLISIKVDSNTY